MIYTHMVSVLVVRNNISLMKASIKIPQVNITLILIRKIFAQCFRHFDGTFGDFCAALSLLRMRARGKLLSKKVEILDNQ